MSRLIKQFESASASTLEDLLLVMTWNVEGSLLQAGGKPGRNYTILDCYKLAQSFALEVFKSKDAKVTLGC